MQASLPEGDNFHLYMKEMPEPGEQPKTDQAAQPKEAERHYTHRQTLSGEINGRRYTLTVHSEKAVEPELIYRIFKGIQRASQKTSAPNPPQKDGDWKLRVTTGDKTYKVKLTGGATPEKINNLFEKLRKDTEEVRAQKKRNSEPAARLASKGPNRSSDKVEHRKISANILDPNFSFSALLLGKTQASTKRGSAPVTDKEKAEKAEKKDKEAARDDKKDTAQEDWMSALRSTKEVPWQEFLGSNLSPPQAPLEPAAAPSPPAATHSPPAAAHSPPASHPDLSLPPPDFLPPPPPPSSSHISSNIVISPPPASSLPPPQSPHPAIAKQGASEPIAAQSRLAAAASPSNLLSEAPRSVFQGSLLNGMIIPPREDAKPEVLQAQIAYLEGQLKNLAGHPNPAEVCENLSKLLAVAQNNNANFVPLGGARVPLSEISLRVLQQDPRHLSPQAIRNCHTAIFGFATPIKLELNNALVSMAKNPNAVLPQQLEFLKKALQVNLPLVTDERGRNLGSPMEILANLCSNSPKIQSLVMNDPDFKKYTSGLAVLACKSSITTIVESNRAGKKLKDAKIAFTDPRTQKTENLSFEKFLQRIDDISKDVSPAQLEELEGLLFPLTDKANDFSIKDEGLAEKCTTLRRKIKGLRESKQLSNVAVAQTVGSNFENCSKTWIPLHQRITQAFPGRPSEALGILGKNGKRIDEGLVTLLNPEIGILKFNENVKEGLKAAGNNEIRSAQVVGKFNAGIEDQAYAVTLMYLGAIGKIKEDPRVPPEVRGRLEKLEWQLTSIVIESEDNKLKGKPVSFMSEIQWKEINEEMNSLLAIKR